MKKSKYISKYDFIAYYAKPKSFWFFTNAEIDAAIKVSYEKYNMNLSEVEDENDTGEEEYSLELYKELLEDNSKIDDNNPLIIEGQIVDKNSRSHIQSLFEEDFEVIDLDEKYQGKNNEEKALITLELISKHPKLILFQAVFISKINGVDVITKPDGIVIDKNEFNLYETKATSSAKKHHFLDIYFQARLIESISQLKMKFNFKYFLCIVAFDYANKMECPLIETPYCNIGKSVSYDLKEWFNELDDMDKVIDYGQSIKMGEWTSKSVDYEFYPISITQFAHHIFNDVDNRYQAVKSKKSVEKFKDDALEMQSNFSKIIKELFDHRSKMKLTDMPIIKRPGYGDKSQWKDNDLFIQTRSIYVNNGYDLLKYSGNVLKQTYDMLEKYQIGDELNNYYRSEKKANLIEESLFSKNDVTIFQVKVNHFIEKIKPKKVYFDFETINTATRAFQNTLPFRQIVTQSSVIIDNGEQQPLVCNNLIADPIKIDVEWFKAIVDSLHQGNDYSYIVYNKSFERSRLNEMKGYIGDNSYNLKIDCIIENMVDLADLFDFRKELVIFKELFGFYSIKKVLPLVSKYDPKIFRDVQCLDYKKLEINNGKLCQDKTTQRFFNLMNQKEWDQLAIELKQYCENDVRAMVAVEYFIKNVIANKYPSLLINFK